MNSKTKLIKPTRVPEAFNGIQVNYCKNPACQNFGVPALNPVAGRKNVSDGYTSSGGGTSTQVLICKACRDFPPLKSNQGISEELSRMLADLTPEAAPSCPDSQCANHNIPVGSGKGYYQSYGMTHSGSKRYIQRPVFMLSTVFLCRYGGEFHYLNGPFLHQVAKVYGSGAVHTARKL